MPKELWKGSLLVLIIALYWEKKIFNSTHTKSELTQPHIFSCGVSLPPESQHAIHIYYVKYEDVFTC